MRWLPETVLRPGAPLTGCVFNFNRVGETLTPRLLVHGFTDGTPQLFKPARLGRSLG